MYNQNFDWAFGKYINADIIQYLIGHSQLLIFAGAVFFAESVILSLSFMSGQGLWSIESVFIWSLLGTIVSDTFWYVCGIRFLKLTHQWKLCKGTFEKISDILDRITKNKPPLALLFIKFLYGTRFLATIYAAEKRISYARFLMYDIFGTTIWLFVIVPIGWLAGKGIYNFIPIYKNISYLLLIVFILAALFKSLMYFIRTKILKL